MRKRQRAQVVSDSMIVQSHSPIEHTKKKKSQNKSMKHMPHANSEISTISASSLDVEGDDHQLFFVTSYSDFDKLGKFNRNILEQKKTTIATKGARCIG